MAGYDGVEAPENPAGAVSTHVAVMAQRADFLRAASARRQGVPGFLLQARPRGDDSATIRVGFTCSRKVGNAVIRNRAKRRLREVARAILLVEGRPGWDYVLVGRPGATVSRAYAELLAHLLSAHARVHGAAAPSGPRRPAPSPPGGRRRGRGAVT
jgi:ribonuclease P protein component